MTYFHYMADLLGMPWLAFDGHDIDLQSEVTTISLSFIVASSQSVMASLWLHDRVSYIVDYHVNVTAKVFRSPYGDTHFEPKYAKK